MAYYNGFPSTYQPVYPVQGTQYNQQTQQNSSIIWVSGEAGAKAYLVAPNNTVQLWDSESQTIYLKSADASGMPSMKVLDYTIRENTPNFASKVVPASSEQIPSYATKDDFRAVSDRIKAIETKLSEMEVVEA